MRILPVAAVVLGVLLFIAFGASIVWINTRPFSRREVKSAWPAVAARLGLSVRNFEVFGHLDGVPVSLFWVQEHSMVKSAGSSVSKAVASIVPPLGLGLDASAGEVAAGNVRACARDGAGADALFGPAASRAVERLAGLGEVRVHDTRVTFRCSGVLDPERAEQLLRAMAHAVGEIQAARAARVRGGAIGATSHV